MSVRISKAVIVFVAVTLYLVSYRPSAAFSHGITDGRHAVNWPGANLTSPNITPQEITYLADKLAGTGVAWAVLGCIWGWAEWNPPSASATGPHSYWGPRVQAWHNYDFTSFDQVVSELTARGINIAVGINGHPPWAGGQSCGGGFGTACGKIYLSYRTTFRDNLYDFAYNMASRYPTITNWIIWNEPNLPAYFSPELSGGENVVVMFMDLVMFQGHAAIKNRIPSATVLGPELATCYNYGGDCSFNDNNWGDNRSTRWLADWTDILLRFFPSYFDKFTIHHYSNTGSTSYHAVGSVWNKMVELGQPKQIWTTEFNFRDGTQDTSEQSLANYTCQVYRDMVHERAVFFALFDALSMGGFGLLRNRDLGFAEKPFLYPAFHSIVDGTYSCP